MNGNGLPRFLGDDTLRLIGFGGKGGVGKTTTTAATAIYRAKLHPHKRILAISLDPAHSLGDSFDCAIGTQPTPLAGLPNLWGLEILREGSEASADPQGRRKQSGIWRTLIPHRRASSYP
ncbi:MAG: ArsA-related P-loop ATPase [Dehalococcoidia bacterium]